MYFTHHKIYEQTTCWHSGYHLYKVLFSRLSFAFLDPELYFKKRERHKEVLQLKINECSILGCNVLFQVQDLLSTCTEQSSWLRNSFSSVQGISHSLNNFPNKYLPQAPSKQNLTPSRGQAPEENRVLIFFFCTMKILPSLEVLYFLSS